MSRLHLTERQPMPARFPCTIRITRHTVSPQGRMGTNHRFAVGEEVRVENVYLRDDFYLGVRAGRLGKIKNFRASGYEWEIVSEGT